MSATNLISATEAFSLTKAALEKFDDKEENLLAFISDRINEAAKEGMTQITIKGKSFSRSHSHLFGKEKEPLFTDNVKNSLIAAGYEVDLPHISSLNGDGSRDIMLAISWKE